jgi:hypothetical protein
MRRNHEGGLRAFVHVGGAWYGPSALNVDGCVDRVQIGIYGPGRESSGEFSVQWKVQGGETVPQLQVFDDGWSALAQFPELLAAMAERDSDNLGPADFCALLLSCGVTDQTPYRQP